MRLLIAIPSLDFVHVEFLKSLTALVMRLKNDGVDFEVSIESGTLVYVARDKLAQKAVNGGFTHVLWLDADMVFSDNILEDLMFSGHDFVSGIAHGRRPPHLSCLFESLSPVTRFTSKYPSETFEVAGCGFGCVLITTEILKQVMLNAKACFMPMAAYGEDLAFCLRASRIGVKIYAEPTVRLGHIGHIAIYPEDMDRWFEQLQKQEDTHA